MTVAYSVDLRYQALARKAAGETHREIAAALQISPSCLSKRARWMAHQGRIAPQRLVFIDETWVIHSPINGNILTLYVEKVLAQTLTPSSRSSPSSNT
jgi:hypothetical protein